MADETGARLEQLYRAHAPACVGYARMLCGSASGVAEDLVHDVFVKLLALAAQPDPQRARGYLLAAVRNGAANLRRHESRRRRLLERLRSAGPTFVPPADQGALELDDILARLPEEQREAVYLKVWAGQTFAEIAELTGAPLATAASRFRYGLARIRQLLEPRHDD